ncbi:translocation/assembly module TamB domain-containing protein [Rhodohalobacter sp. 614A]|uniref:translocation/assembly module TamB domain-containing protein n=1 Tax=Rhodohalobacter sp. 614A TaxID=2908649 RepID=UPI001F3EA61E|nr:translocation/assembly module TamB domain-containing protein [Rhodohalobacter sp. 614A]
MNTENEQSKRSYKGWIIAAVAILILGISGRLILKSDWLFNKLRGIAVEQANQQLQGSLSIGSIRGDVLNGFMIRDVSVQDTSSTQVAQIDSVNINYDFFSVLFSPHTIESVEVFGAEILVEQYADSTWNVLGLIPPADQPAQETEPLYWYVENFSLAGTNIEVRSEQYLPDDVLYVDRAFANLSAGMLESGISATLRDLGFAIRESRFPEAVDVYLAGAAQGDQYTLDSIVISTGRSVLRGSGQYEEGGELQQNIELSPLSWQDISEFAANVPIEQNIQLELSADGTLDNLRLTLDASADGLNQFQVQAILSLQEPMALNELSITVQGLNAPVLTGLENSPVIESVDLQGNGIVLFGSLSDSNWEGSVDIRQAGYQPYEFDHFTTHFSLEEGSLEVDGNIQYQNEQVALIASADSLFGTTPDWEFHVNTDQINPGVWLQNEEYAGNLNIRIDATGQGFDPSNFSSSADIIIAGREIQGQEFSRLAFSGSLNQDRIIGELTGQLQESNANMEIELYDWRSVPEYEFNLVMNRLNLAELNGLEEFPTYINGSIEGRGTSFDPQQMRMFAEANFDSSIVNGEEVRELNTDFRIENEFIIVDDGALQSPIADASFSFNQHLFDITNRANRLNFNASLKDLMPLAPLFEMERLESQGSISGNLGRSADGMLEFNGELELEDVVVDTLFNAEEISGRLTSYVIDEPELDLNVTLTEPSVYQKTVQDVELYLYAKKRETGTTGNIKINLSNGNESSLAHSGEFTIDSTRSTLLTQTLEFRTQLRELSLEEPFLTTVENSRVSVDTLTISTDQGEAFLKLWVPRVDSLVQEGGLDAQNLNVGVLQQTILKESYLDGYLNGSANLYNSPDSLDVSAEVHLTELELSSGQMDSLKVTMDVRQEWLTASLESWHESKKLAEGSFKVPFLPGDPLTFDDQFFERDVNGRFRVYESQLSYWLSFLPEGAPESTNGTVQMDAELGGIAGNPDLDGELTVSNGLFSGIRVDTVGVDIAYRHENEWLDLSGSIVRDQLRILDFEANLPFQVDLRQAQVDLPTSEDELFIDVTTNNFDLALLNSYVNRDRVRNISGRLEGAVTLSGVMNDLQTDGQMQLTRGSLRVIPAGITLNDVSSTMLFTAGGVELQSFSATSGPGRLRANGTVNLQNLEPGEMDISISANQFRLLNTSDYNAIINLSASLSGTAEEPRINGNLTFLNGFYYLQDFGESSVEEVELEGESETEESVSFYEALDMEMTVGFDRQFFIRNQQYLEMEVELGGQVDLVKEPNEDMQIFGTLEGVDGYASPLGKQFELEEALVSFYGPANNPELQIRSSYSPPQAAEVQIFYVIEGTLEEPEFRFESQPQMELQDILSYTLFGRPFYELESWEQVVAGSSNSPSAADYALQVVLDRVEMLASQRLGIDVVQIDNSRSGSNNTVIKTGWYLNRSTFFAILNEIDGSNPKTLFMLEIMLKDNLELIITQGDDTRQGIDLQWKRDY